MERFYQKFLLSILLSFVPSICYGQTHVVIQNVFGGQNITTNGRLDISTQKNIYGGVRVYQRGHYVGQTRVSKSGLQTSTFKSNYLYNSNKVGQTTTTTRIK